MMKAVRTAGILEDEPPVLQDLWPELGVIQEGFSVVEQPMPGGFLVQLESQDTQIALVLLFLAGQLADENVVFIDDIHAEAAEVAEPLSRFCQ